MKDAMLLEAGQGRIKDVAFDKLFLEQPETDEEQKAQKKKEKAKKKESAAGKKNDARAREKERRREDKLLNSRKTPEEVKQEILARRAERAEAEMQAAIGANVKRYAEETPLSERERKRIRREEDRILKSKKASEEEKAEILERRAEAGKESLRKMAEAKEAGASRRPMKEIIPFTGIQDGYIEYLHGSYYYKFGPMDLTEIRSNVFRADEVFYDLKVRNARVLGTGQNAS